MSSKKEMKLPPAVSSSWWQTAKEDLQRAEYRISPLKNKTPLFSHQAPNRPNNLRALFNAQGIQVTPRTVHNALPWTWGLELESYGRGENLCPASPGVLKVSGNKAENIRKGLTEWYVNDPKGLEHGFTIQKAPSSDKEGSLPLTIRMRIMGDLQGKIVGDGKTVDFKSTDGTTVLSYSGLKVFDADGKTLFAVLKPAKNTLTIEIDDRGSRYPIVIDPLVTTPAWTAEGDQENALFGFSVASAGDVNDDGFSDVIVGAMYYDNGQTDEGRTFVYHGSSAGLSTTPAWSAESNQKRAEFGRSVASAGDVNGDGFSDVIVGANNFSNGHLYEGRVFVYHGSAAGLSAAPAWSAESNQNYANFGWWVDSAGDVNGDGFSDVIIGAIYYDNGQADEGRVFVYHGSPAGLAAAPAWTTESNQNSANFGNSVASAGDVNDDGYSDVIVGAYQYTNGQTSEGGAFVYHGSAAGLTTIPNWSAESNQTSARLGRSVASAGDVNGDGFSDVIVGRKNFAFAFHGSAAGLTTTPNWSAENDQPGAKFGHAVSSAGDVNGDGYSDVIVGAHQYNSGATEYGRAFVYYGGGDSEPSSPVLSHATSGLNLNLNWTSVPSATGYRLCYTLPPYIGPESLTCMDMNNQTSLSVALWEGATLYVAAQAYNTFGASAFSNVEQIFMTALPPAAPVLTYAVSGLNLTVNWTSVPGATGYRFYFAPNPYAGPESIASVDMAQTTGFTLALWPGAAFHIAVQAYNSQGNSNFSNINTIFISP